MKQVATSQAGEISRGYSVMAHYHPSSKAHNQKNYYPIFCNFSVAVRELLEKLNDKPFKKLRGSRRSQFILLDKPALKPLPCSRYEYSQIKKVPVSCDYHIDYDQHFYSVPYQYRGEVLEVRATASTVEIFRYGKRIVSHPRSYSETKRNVTLIEHRPKHHHEYGDWNPERISAWAAKVGASTSELLASINDRHHLPEQGFRSCQGILPSYFGMARTLETQYESPQARELSFEERLAMLLEAEALTRDNQRSTSGLRKAKLGLPASFEDIKFKSGRGLDRALIVSLATCDWIRSKRNISITGPTGVGVYTKHVSVFHSKLNARASWLLCRFAPD